MTNPLIDEEKHSTKTNQKSFEIERTLHLSLRDNKCKNLSDTLSNKEEDSI